MLQRSLSHTSKFNTTSGRSVHNALRHRERLSRCRQRILRCRMRSTPRHVSNLAKRLHHRMRHVLRIELERAVTPVRRSHLLHGLRESISRMQRIPVKRHTLTRHRGHLPPLTVTYRIKVRISLQTRTVKTSPLQLLRSQSCITIRI